MALRRSRDQNNIESNAVAFLNSIFSPRGHDRSYQKNRFWYQLRRFAIFSCRSIESKGRELPILLIQCLVIFDFCSDRKTPAASKSILLGA